MKLPRISLAQHWLGYINPAIRMSVCLLIARAPATMAEAPKFDIVDILRQFVITETAARACGSSDPDSGALFAQNRAIVVRVAADTLAARNPAISHNQLVMRETQFVAEVVAHTAALINADGCGSPKIKSLLDLYRAQAHMDFSAVQ